MAFVSSRDHDAPPLVANGANGIAPAAALPRLDGTTAPVPTLPALGTDTNSLMPTASLDNAVVSVLYGSSPGISPHSTDPHRLVVGNERPTLIVQQPDIR